MPKSSKYSKPEWEDLRPGDIILSQDCTCAWIFTENQTCVKIHSEGGSFGQEKTDYVRENLIRFTRIGSFASLKPSFFKKIRDEVE